MKRVYESPWMKIDIENAAKPPPAAVAATAPRGNMLALAEAEGDVAYIVVDGEIGGYDWTAETWKECVRLQKQQFRKDIDALKSLDVSTVVVLIDSPGGSAAHVVSMHDILAEMPAKIITRVTGDTASSATVLAQAASPGCREISDNALFLIHMCWNPWMSGNLYDIEEFQSDQMAINNQLAGIYAKRAGKETEYFLEIMREFRGNGRWMTASEAKEHGLVDEVYEPTKMHIAACANRKFDPVAMGLPAIPAGVKSRLPEKPAEQNNIDNTGGQNAPQPKPKPSKENSNMKMTKEQFASVKKRFGADFACEAVANDLSFEEAVDKGSETQATRLAEVSAALETEKAEKAAIQAKLEKAEAEKLKLKNGLKDPLENDGGHTPPADDTKSKKADAEAAKDEAELEGILNHVKETDRVR